MTKVVSYICWFNPSFHVTKIDLILETNLMQD